jgi:hypothetical protein
VALLIVGVPAPVAAQNLLVNPDLTTDLSGWSVIPATSFDSTRGSPAAGSARWVATLAAPFDVDDVVFLEQCVDGVVAGQTYSFGGELLPTTLPAGATAGIFILWRGTACGGGVSDIERVAAPAISATGSFQSTSWSAVAPAGAVAAEINAISGIAAFPPGPVTGPVVFVAGSYEVNADTLFFQLVPPVPTMGPFWLLVLTLALVIVATRVLRSFNHTPA